MPFRIEGERNVAVKVISAQILICLTIMRSSISLEEKRLRVSRMGCSVQTLQRRRALHFVGRATCLLFVVSVLVWVPVFVPF